MTSHNIQKRSKRRWSMILGIPLLMILLIGGGLLAMPESDQMLPGADATFEVVQGPLTINVIESGTIKARDQQILKSEVEGQTTIIQLVPEGKMVEAGELLVELDASELQDQKVDQQIQVQNAEAAHIQASEAYEVAKNKAESDIAKAELDYRFAKEDVKQYVEGEYPKLLMEAESNITLAKEEMERASEKLKWSETLFKEKYISQTELEADRLTKSRAELSHKLAVAERDLLKNYTYNRQMDQLKSDVEQTRMALERVRRQAQADIVQAEAEFKAKDLEYKQQQDKLKKIEDQIAKTKIHAPVAGMVIYATSAKGGWRGNDEPLDEGYVVREREELIYLPTADAMMAEIKVHESNLDKVSPGLPVRITVDALPGKSFTGVVTTIAPLPDAQSIWLNPDLKVYNTHIALDGSHSNLRTGMSCRTEIIVKQYDDVVYVPIQSVIRVNDQPVVYWINDKQVEQRPVVIGLDNNRMVHVVSGLQGGERVLLKPPMDRSSVPLDRGDGNKQDDGDKRDDQPGKPAEDKVASDHQEVT